MVWFWCFLAAVLAVTAGLLMLRVRIRLELSDDRRLLFAGVGRTGSEMDFVRRYVAVKLFGVTVRRLPMDADRAATAPGTEAEAAGVSSAPRRSDDSALTVPGDISDWLEIAPHCLRAVERYLPGLLRAVIVERAEGEIEGGFEAPDLTGQVYGYYQAALAAAPRVMSRVRFIPVWTGAAFSASLRVSVALPLYRLVWQTVLLVWRLPLRRIVNLMRHTKQGARDDE